MHDHPLNRRPLLLALIATALLAPDNGGSSGHDPENGQVSDTTKTKEESELHVNVPTTDTPPETAAMPDGMTNRGQAMISETDPLRQLPMTATTPDIIATINKIVQFIDPEAPMIHATHIQPMTEEEYTAASLRAGEETPATA